jgi:hypothetical protein
VSIRLRPSIGLRSDEFGVIRYNSSQPPAPALARTLAPLRLDYVQRDAAFRIAADLELEVVVAGTFKVKTEMLPDVSVCLRLITGNSNFEILSYRLEDGPHVWIAEVHLNRVAALLAHIKSELTCDCTHWMITGKRMSADRIKRSKNIQFAASDRGSIAKCENFSLHRENICA